MVEKIAADPWGEVAARQEVAAEVDALIRGLGLTRAEFAARIGASAPRLSAYATGKGSAGQ